MSVLIKHLKETVKEIISLIFMLKVRLSIKNIFGIKKIHLLPTEFAVICAVKNGEFFIDDFIKHYQSLGCKHIFFVDNESEDKTVDKIKNNKNVSIFKSSLNMGKYEVIARRYMASNFVNGGWCLSVDIDEFFDFPWSDKINLNDLLDYLNNQNYDLVVCHMLDMFSDLTNEEFCLLEGENLLSTYKYYDISDIKKELYSESSFARLYGMNNCLSNKETKIYWGGVRRRLYGHDALLTKTPLISRQKKISLYTHIHFSDNCRLADIDCVLIHYKFTSNLIQSTLLNRDVFNQVSNNYNLLFEFLVNKPDLSIINENSKKYRNVNQLIEDEFILVSDQYRKYVNDLET